VIRAAGGVVVREGGGGVEVLVVHRPRYDDWTFPKGKALADEPDEECAIREVEEETGLQCALGRELVSTEYVDGHGREKRVRYWLMRVDAGTLAFRNEVDDAAWLSPAEAARRLTYRRDLPVLESVRADA
jgi:8-oxo-dGTP pyrophosphatase MutT (NUDIX family)